MSDRRDPPIAEIDRPPLVALPGGGEGGQPPPGRPRRLKLRRLRLLALLSGLGVLAAVSTLFGMMMAVASDLPEIDVLDVATRPSQIVDRDGKPLGVLTSNQNRILLRSDQIAPVVKHAVVAIEDRRFYTNSGVDLRGISRAFFQDVVKRNAVQGGSTIAQQLVKNRLDAQDDRTVFQKLREAAMAFHMTRKWDKERILRNYLNTIYFGNGAYGIEAAARTYFGTAFGLGTPGARCGSAADQKRCAELLQPAQAALIAAVVANPSAFDPVAQPQAARKRRDLVLSHMRDEDFLTQMQYESALREPLPTARDVTPPVETGEYPYFTTWARQQVVDKVGPGKAFEGGLKVRTTIDSDLQEAAQRAVTQNLAQGPGTPAAAVVALDNKTSQVLAMVGGPPGGYNEQPFNLATQGQRQPGSSFKPFILAQALQDGVSPNSTWTSKKKDFCVDKTKHGCGEHFVVNNYDDAYSGVTTLANATAFSDNSVFAELGLQVGTKRIARLARELGIRTPVSSNYAMTLGGLSQGVTVMDMAHAYESFASGGQFVYGSLSPGADGYERRHHKGTVPGPVGIRQISEPRSPRSSQYRTARMLDGSEALNRTHDRRVLPAATAGAVEDLLAGVVRYGSGSRAAVGGTLIAGKTGTTENYGDAWFVGWSPRYTVAVWVGYPSGTKSMQPPSFSFNGEPVAGGTYPAAIWGSFMREALAIDARKHPDTKDPAATATPVPSTGTVAPAPTAVAPSAPTATPTAAAPTAPTAVPKQPQTPQTPKTPAVPDSGGGGGGGGGQSQDGTGGTSSGGATAAPNR